MTLVVSPKSNSSEMLAKNVGSDSEMLSSCAARTSNAVVCRLDQQERATIAKENAWLQKWSAQYNDSEWGDRFTGLSGGVGTGALLWSFLPGGFGAGLVTFGVAGSTTEQARLARNREACQNIAFTLFEVGLERVKRLFEKEELIEEEIQRLAAVNNRLFPPQFSLWSPSTWWSNGTGNRELAEPEAQKLVTQNTIDISHLQNIQEHFRRVRCFYVSRFSEIALRNKCCRVGEWKFQLSYKNKRLAIDPGQQAA